MFSKFRVPKRDVGHLEDDDTEGLILVSTSRISGTGAKRWVYPKRIDVSRSCGNRVGRPIHNQKCAGCVKDRQSVKASH